ncbi:MAG: GAF domain-containing protein [Proteobacteria bacterium]|nr:GAF domain-containing protein [Pseudomonadota bacterium]
MTESPAFGAADLTNCDREPIHIPGSIQPHGALLAVDPDTLRILQAGGATGKFLGAAPSDLLGQRINAVLPPECVGTLRTLLLGDGATTRPQHAFRLSAQDSPPADVTLHGSGGLIILEFEAVQDHAHDDALVLVQTMLARLQKTTSSAALCQAIAQEVRRVSGFDRVMVYRFLPDRSGIVAGEVCGPDAEAFLGLHYPASDIPQQARELYRTNWVRSIVDVHYTPEPITPLLNPVNGQPLDLSHSTLRSVSPIHLEYLSNMGVAASMSLSLIMGGQLWGLIACHHNTPRFVPFRHRAAYELFAQMASAKLEMQVATEQYDRRLHTSQVHDSLVNYMSQEADLANGLTRYKPNLLDYISADGVGLWFDGQYTSLGRVPDAEQVAGLIAWLNGSVKGGVFQTDHLPSLHAPAETFADVASGILALAVSKAPRDYILWFRGEFAHTVTWAGDPRKAITTGPHGDRLSPRKSFAAWRETVRLRSRPWEPAEVEAVHTLRVSLLEVVLSRIDQLAREREQARLAQQALVVELDHRLEEWRATEADLKQETERRAALETDLSQVLRSTVEQQEAERQRIARELHDTVGQKLTLLQLSLDALRRAPAADIPLHIAGLKRLTNDVGSSMNRLAWEIRPTELDDLGLEQAIQHLAETWSERTNLQFKLHLALNDRRLDRAVEITLYRVLQEALTNVVRHADATLVSVILEADEKQVRLVVEDDGRGFAVDEPSGGKSVPRLGLLGIRERLAAVSGELEVESSPNNGCTLFVRVPL